MNLYNSDSCKKKLSSYTKVKMCIFDNMSSIALIKQAISARKRALCQLTVCFEFQGRSERRKGHNSCALQMVVRSTKLTVKV